MSDEIDLWGDPIPPRTEKRGRPKHDITDEKRKRVSALASLNWNQTDIAAALGISEPTLRQHYSSDLRQGPKQKRAEAHSLLWDAARKGNVAAIKEILRQFERADLTAPKALAPARTERRGKKAQADFDAATPDQSTTIGEIMARRAAAASGTAH